MSFCFKPEVLCRLQRFAVTWKGDSVGWLLNEVIYKAKIYFKKVFYPMLVDECWLIWTTLNVLQEN